LGQRVCRNCRHTLSVAEGFIHLFMSETEDDILGELPSFQAFAKSTSDRMVAPPDVNHGLVIGAYRFPAF
jgi:hypothetical protein